MISQAERDFRKVFTGNTAYYLDIERHRSRTFLQRNLSRILAYHGRQQRALQSQDFGPENMITKAGQRLNGTSHHAGKSASSSTHMRRPRWSVEELCKGLRDGSIKPQQAVLKVEPKALRKRSAAASNSGSLADPPNKRQKQPDIRCYCGLTVWGPRSPESNPLVKKSQECTVKTSITPTGEVIAWIEMDEPLLVNAGELFVSVQRPNHTRMTLTDSYYMEIMLLPLDSREVWPTVLVKPVKGRLSPQVDDILADQLKNDQGFVAKWTKLPNCPPKGTLLSMQAFKNRKPYKANISLELDAAWSHSTSPLEIYNSRLRIFPADRFPTPISEPEAQESIAKPTVTVVWTFGAMYPGGKKTMTLTGYLCPACQRRDFVNLELLQFHLITSHDLFKFQITAEQQNDALTPQDVVSIDVTVANEYRNKAANHVNDDREFCWERPKGPFDLQSFLTGDESWTGKCDHPRSTAIQQQILKNSRSQTQNALSWTLENSDPFTVPNLPSANRKKHAVPAAPSEVTFFRANAKRPLKEDEPISESDDDVDETWFWHKHDELIESFSNMPESEKRFMKHYDAFMLKEDICGNAHFANALVRFCRENKAWLEEPDMFKEFLRNAAGLISQGSIHELVLRGCIRTIQGTTEPLEKPISRRRNRRRRTILSDMDSECEDASLPLPAHGDVDMPDVVEASGKDPRGNQVEALKSERGIGISYSTCECGEKIRDLNITIICANLVSLNSHTDRHQDGVSPPAGLDS